MTAFRPIPDYVPPTEGLWGKDFAWQSWDLREKGTKRIVTARRQRLFACCCEWRSLPKFEERYACGVWEGNESLCFCADLAIEGESQPAPLHCSSDTERRGCGIGFSKTKRSTRWNSWT